MQRESIVWILLLATVGTTACDRVSAKPRFFARNEWSASVRCPRISALGELSAVADITSVTDSTFAVVLPDERRLIIFDAAFAPVDTMTFDKDGPRGVLHPASALVTDTMVFVADDARSAIRYFTPSGDDAGTARLSFIPRRIRLSGGRLVVAPLVAGGSPAELLFEIRGRRASPLGGPIARYDDIGVNTLANLTSLAAFADRVVLMHEMVVPFGYVIRPADPANMVRRFGVPVAAELRDRLGRVPREPLSDRNVNDLAVVAFAAAPVPPSGSLFYVTRTDSRRGRYQKLLVRLDSLLNVEAVIPVDVNPQHMVYLAARGSLIVVDSNSEWFECKVS